MNEILAKILTDLINQYWSYTDQQIDVMLQIKGYEIKEKVGRINDLNVIIYSNDHNPPHFHVISNDKKIDAKFTIENCEKISGELNSKQLRKIRAFYESPKTQILMEKILNKKNQ